MADEKLSNLFAFDSNEALPAHIRVVGIGGGGGNALNNMIEKGIDGIEFIAINTDVQALHNNKAPHKIQIGRTKTKGMGAGARSTIGAEAATESQDEIEQALEGSDMVFITAGMGGGTGTGAAPVVAAIAKRLGILTVAIVTKPFTFEGGARMRTARDGIRLLSEHVDTLILIPNDRLLDISDSKTTITEAFQMADSVLHNATRGISELITIHGMVNLDFADVRTTMENGGTSLMGYATAAGEKRAERAAREAISSPLLDGISIAGARNVLINITAGPSLTMQEANEASMLVQQEAGNDAEVIWGIVNDERMGDDLRITVIATGFSLDNKQAAPEQTRTMLTDPEQYKGEESLRTLDEPAFQRRGGSAAARPQEKQPAKTERQEKQPVKPRSMPMVAGTQAAAAPAASAVKSPKPMMGTEERDKQGAVQLVLGPELGRNGNGSSAGKSTVRLMSAEDLDSAGRTQSRDDKETPAFLRRMMD